MWSVFNGLELFIRFWPIGTDENWVDYILSSIFHSFFLDSFNDSSKYSVYCLFWKLLCSQIPFNLSQTTLGQPSPWALGGIGIRRILHADEVLKHAVAFFFFILK